MESARDLRRIQAGARALRFAFAVRDWPNTADPDNVRRFRFRTAGLQRRRFAAQHKCSLRSWSYLSNRLLLLPLYWTHSRPRVFCDWLKSDQSKSKQIFDERNAPENRSRHQHRDFAS